MDIKPVVIEATVMWAFLDKINDMSGKYQVDLCNLSDKDAKALSALGVSVKENDSKPEKGKFITCKSNYKINVQDRHGSDIEGIVGNGSKAKALIGTYTWKFKGKSGTSPTLKKFVITDLVEYTGDVDAGEEDLVL